MDNVTMDDVFDEYAKELQIVKNNYLLVGKLLNKKAIRECVDAEIKGDIYIYGAETMGILTYEALKEGGRVLGIVDKSGGIRLDYSYIPVLNIDMLREKYKGETIIITLGYHFKSVVNDLKEFIPMNKLLYLGEVIGGVE